MTLRSRAQVVSSAVNRLALITCVGCVLAMLSISFVGFFYMVITGEALSWTYSLARLFIPWIGMLSITVAFHDGEHVAMNMVPRMVPKPLAVAMRYAVLMSVAVFAALLLWFGWRFFESTSQYYMVSDQIQIHARWVAVCVPVSGAILLVHLVNGFGLLEAPDADLYSLAGATEK
jgi:TRAP-type C4-dicarboxylate transport system permease small subunit